MKKLNVLELARFTQSGLIVLPICSVVSVRPELVEGWRYEADGDTRVCHWPVHNKVISGFQALRQASAPVAGLEPATKGLLQILGRIQSCISERATALFSIKPGVKSATSISGGCLSGSRRLSLSPLIVPGSGGAAVHNSRPDNPNNIYTPRSISL
ncbi:hypothetical protein PoB_006152300 [Plakobranchus ocellatus]|uniref:Uncharacterized protein n=1 Tax=Plakobranchus ocellatus TaxID=259542 RepID=A0AAV4CT37_9GAST|nr:hypothetical protein PoB_006152300 [Plakobranchus ocellatus]